MLSIKKIAAGFILIVLGAILLVIGLVHLIKVYERVTAQRPYVTVTIPEGSTIYDIDRILSGAGVIQQDALIDTTSSLALEGKLFPDTYDFFPSSTIPEVLQKFTDDFNAKAAPLFAADPNEGRDLIIASLVQKEVASSTDMAIVAGIIDKRLAANNPLDIDATICYIKQMEHPTSTAGCYPLAPSDYKIKSPYNTYLYDGLPPGPISNPGVVAIQAALHPETSTYFYYLSDPKTGATIYAVTLAQQMANQRKYLGD